jgi:sugar lactone lactonase YvrE
VFKYSTTGHQLARFEGGIEGLAYAIAVDSADRVFVSDDRYIQVYDSGGSYLGRVTLPNNAGPMHALAFGPRNELYALFTQSGMVYRFAVTK